MDQAIDRVEDALDTTCLKQIVCGDLVIDRPMSFENSSSTLGALQLGIKGLIDKYFEQASAVTGHLNKEIVIQVAAGISFLEIVGSTVADTSRQLLQGVSKLPPSVIKDGRRTASTL